MKINNEIQKALGNRVKENVILAPYTTFKIGGPADLFYEAQTIDQLVLAVKAARKYAVPFFLLGGGTNILIGDKGYRGFVIRNCTSKIAIRAIYQTASQNKKQTVFVESESGVPFNKLVRFAIEEGLSGIEMHLGLPGSVGGAIYMNSKWTKPVSYVGESVYRGEVLTKTNERITVPQSYFHFAYDASSIQKNEDIVLRVFFAFTRVKPDALWGRANESMEYRKKTQPQGVKTAGCVFQNISTSEALAIPTPNNTTSAGFLIDHAGLKGKTIGGAKVSESHANFIINLGQAKASDVIQLINLIKERVKAQFHVDLREEIRIVGEF